MAKELATYAIEHIMPRKWHAHWPLDGSSVSEAERDRIIHTLGNLTLLTGRMNSKVSNGSWIGSGGKREALGPDVLLLNREVLRQGESVGDEERIRKRTDAMIDAIIQVWPVPPGHQSGASRDVPRRLRSLPSLSDLIAVGALHGGMSLCPTKKVRPHSSDSLLSDGSIEIDGTAYEGPSRSGDPLGR